MKNKNTTPPKILITTIVTIVIFGLLFWQHLHGGVPSHHMLQRADLPGITNWWGGLLLPVLTWLALGRIEKRLNKQAMSTQTTDNQNIKILGRFFIGLILGLLIAVSFTNDYQLFLDNVPFVLLLLSLLVPIYYSEFMLGFILGMSYTFGAFLPTVFILIFAGMGYLVFRFIRPLILRVFGGKPFVSL
ncbi:MAG: hypothetical protein NW218_11355 [Saprospiraceae bacterium]|nr:hypothetical protein [Saprospiraceae bacterium]